MDKNKYINKAYKKEEGMGSVMLYIYDDAKTTAVWGVFTCITLDLLNSFVYLKDPYTLSEITDSSVELSNKYIFMKTIFDIKIKGVSNS